MAEQKKPHKLEHEPVDSSTIRTIGYDPDKKELHVDFHGSGRYVYHNVPQRTFDGLMESESKGKYLNMHIKATHGYTKI